MEKTIDFRKVTVKDLAGKELRFDVSKSLGNFVYQTTGDLGMFEVSQKMYSEGAVVLNPEQRMELASLIRNPKCPFIALVKKRLLEMLEG